MAAATGVLQKAAPALGNFLAAAFALQVYLCHRAASLVRELEVRFRSLHTATWYGKQQLMSSHDGCGDTGLLYMQTSGANSKYETRAEALLAGMILTAISTVLLIIWIGNSSSISGMVVGQKKVRQLSAPGILQSSRPPKSNHAYTYIPKRHHQQWSTQRWVGNAVNLPIGCSV